jgi:hypothetical protein
MAYQLGSQDNISVIVVSFRTGRGSSAMTWGEANSLPGSGSSSARQSISK